MGGRALDPYAIMQELDGDGMVNNAIKTDAKKRRNRSITSGQVRKQNMIDTKRGRQCHEALHKLCEWYVVRVFSSAFITPVVFS